MDSGGSEFCISRDSLSGRRLAPGRRRAHEFAREDTYERDTSFYSEMACAPVTRLSGLSTSSARVPSGARPPLHKALSHTVLLVARFELLSSDDPARCWAK